ncbi:MAG: hypothetical protein WDN24_12755 [Sphingomonas sp.]
MRVALSLGFASFLIAATLFAATMGHDAAAFGQASFYLGILRSAFYIGLAVGGCAYAIRCGGAPEAIVGAIVLAGLVADPVLHLLLRARFETVDPTHLVLDIGRFTGFAAVALLANRFWPVWISAFQLLAVGAHIAKAMDLAIHPVVYAAMGVMWSYGMLAVLILATHYHRRLLARGATRRSWSVFSPRSAWPRRTRRHG